MGTPCSIYLLLKSVFIFLTSMKTEMNGTPVEVSFKVGIPDIPPGTVRITRKANKIEILQPWDVNRDITMGANTMVLHMSLPRSLCKVIAKLKSHWQGQSQATVWEVDLQELKVICE